MNNQRSDSEPGQFRTLGEETGATNFLVVKLTFGPAHRAVAEVFRNPASRADEAAAKADARLEGDFRFSRIALARFVGGTPAQCVDEIRVATRYADVFSVPDEAAVREYLAAAESQVTRQIEASRARLAQLAARGIDVAAWRAPLEAIAARGEEPVALAASGIAAAAGRIAGPGRHGTRLRTDPAGQAAHVPADAHLHGSQRRSVSARRRAVSTGPAPPRRRDPAIFDARGGIVRDPDLSYDGRLVLFAWRPAADDYYHIYEIGLDGSGLRQLTSGPFHDLDPFYLPDGRIGLTSTRCKSRALCFWVRAATLFVMDADGGHIQPLTANNVSEFTPQMLADGRILYTRWEYLDKSAIFVQSLWAILRTARGPSRFTATT